ncbi:hypothetical protein ACHHYP_09658 [Achlya hypogyna]|uniref:Myb-like domain-containing protein n=1 Tax=Achlya hypogyna TaxID=1202772 RepID=A0A1V9YMN6_ACHHY|nr:hypothetical protein ACHHYP_09658 [Achlya hypogyna]
MLASPRWSQHQPSSSVFIWTSAKDEALEVFVATSIRESLEAADDVDDELAREIYAARFPLGVDWKAIAVALLCTPVECVRRYAELKTTHASQYSGMAHVLHSPRLGNLTSPTLPTSPLLSPPPFALQTATRPFKWEPPAYKPADVEAIEDALDSMDMDDLAAEMNPFDTTDSTASLSHSALAEAFLDIAGSRLDAPSMLLQSRLNKSPTT